jgi:hypothetical protein
MGCGLCHRDERGADKGKEYLCGKCVVTMVSMDRDQKRVFIDDLYLQGKDEEAEFLESFFKSGVSQPKRDEPEETGEEKPVLLIRRKAV